MSFDWQGQRILLKGENPPKFQTIELKQLSSLVGNHKQVAGYFLCSLSTAEEEKQKAAGSVTLVSQFEDIKDNHLQHLL